MQPSLAVVGNFVRAVPPLIVRQCLRVKITVGLQAIAYMVRELTVFLDVRPTKRHRDDMIQRRRPRVRVVIFPQSRAKTQLAKPPVTLINLLAVDDVRIF